MTKGLKSKMDYKQKYEESQTKYENLRLEVTKYLAEITDFQKTHTVQTLCHRFGITPSMVTYTKKGLKS